MKAAFNTHTKYVVIYSHVGEGKKGKEKKRREVKWKSHRCLRAQVGILFMNLEQNYTHLEVIRVSSILKRTGKKIC